LLGNLEIGDGILYTEDDVKKICPSTPSSLGLIIHESFILSKYSEDDPIIYKLSEFKKTQVMKNQHVLLIIKETKYCSVHCHALESSNFMTILNHRKRMDTDQHCGVLVETYNLF
jgi:hypothetical protein